MKSCISCGDALHPERAEKYDYCTKPECQEKNAKGLTIVSVGVNKSSDQFMVLNEETSEDLASGKHHDPRRGSYGRQGGTPAGYPASQRAPERSPDPVPPSKPRPEARSASRPARPRRQWTESQQKLAVLYDEQGLSPDKIAEKLGLSRYTVTQMIRNAPPPTPLTGRRPYVCDWVLDDQPVELATRTAPIVNIPYTQECNDVAMMLIQHHPAREYFQRAVDQFDQLYKDSAESARVMALVVHPYIMGAPHRLRYFEEALQHIRAHEDIEFWTGEQILDWYRQARPARSL
jgi:hypothetical protein